MTLYPLVWYTFSHTHTHTHTRTCKHSWTHNFLTNTHSFSHATEHRHGPPHPQNINYQTLHKRTHKHPAQSRPLLPHTHTHTHTHTQTHPHIFVSRYVNTQTHPHAQTYKHTNTHTQWHTGLIPWYFLQATPWKETMLERKHFHFIPPNQHTHTHTHTQLYTHTHSLDMDISSEKFKNFGRKEEVIFLHYSTSVCFYMLSFGSRNIFIPS